MAGSSYELKFSVPEGSIAEPAVEDIDIIRKELGQEIETIHQKICHAWPASTAEYKISQYIYHDEVSSDSGYAHTHWHIQTLLKNFPTYLRTVTINDKDDWLLQACKKIHEDFLQVQQNLQNYITYCTATHQQKVWVNFFACYQLILQLNEAQFIAALIRCYTATRLKACGMDAKVAVVATTATDIHRCAEQLTEEYKQSLASHPCEQPAATLKQTLVAEIAKLNTEAKNIELEQNNFFAAAGMLNAEHKQNSTVRLQQLVKNTEAYFAVMQSSQLRQLRQQAQNFMQQRDEFIMRSNAQISHAFARFTEVVLPSPDVAEISTLGSLRHEIAVITQTINKNQFKYHLSAAQIAALYQLKNLVIGVDRQPGLNAQAQNFITQNKKQKMPAARAMCEALDMGLQQLQKSHVFGVVIISQHEFKTLREDGLCESELKNSQEKLDGILAAMSASGEVKEDLQNQYQQAKAAIKQLEYQRTSIKVKREIAVLRQEREQKQEEFKRKCHAIQQEFDQRLPPTARAELCRAVVAAREQELKEEVARVKSLSNFTEDHFRELLGSWRTLLQTEWRALFLAHTEGLLNNILATLQEAAEAEQRLRNQTQTGNAQLVYEFIAGMFVDYHRLQSPEPSEAKETMPDNEEARLMPRTDSISSVVYTDAPPPLKPWQHAVLWGVLCLFLACFFVPVIGLAAGVTAGVTFAIIGGITSLSGAAAEAVGALITIFGGFTIGSGGYGLQRYFKCDTPPTASIPEEQQTRHVHPASPTPVAQPRLLPDYTSTSKHEPRLFQREPTASPPSAKSTLDGGLRATR